MVSRQLDVAAAVVLTILAASRISAFGVPLVVVAGVLLLPIWWTAAAGVVSYRALAIAGVAAAVVGVVVAVFRPEGRGLIFRDLVAQTALLLSVVVGVGILIWLRELCGDWVAGLTFGFGSFLAIRPNAGFLDDPWRFGFAVPTILVVLAVSAKRRNPWLELGACTFLLLTLALSGARSRTGVLLIVALLVLFQTWGIPRRGFTAAVRVVVVLALGALATYELGQAVVLEGYLGEAAQQRSVQQIDQSGSLILGGRPEMAASTSLFRADPWGFGAGVTPSMHDVAVAKSGLLGIGYSPDNDYVEGYMFGHGVEVHSVIGDLWARHSLGGLLFVGVAVVIILAGLGRRVARRSAGALLVFCGLSALWDLAFSPMLTSAPLLMLALGLSANISHLAKAAPLR